MAKHYDRTAWKMVRDLSATILDLLDSPCTPDPESGTVHVEHGRHTLFVPLKNPPPYILSAILPAGPANHCGGEEPNSVSVTMAPDGFNLHVVASTTMADVFWSCPALP